MRQKVYIHHNDKVVFECPSAAPCHITSRRYGRKYSCHFCPNPAAKLSEGYKPNCINLPEGTKVTEGATQIVNYFEFENFQQRKYRRSLAVKTYPFLRRLVNRNCVYVTVDENFDKWYARSPYFFRKTGKFINREQGQKVFLVFRDGRRTMDDAIKQHGFDYSVDISKMEIFKGETLKEGLCRQGISPDDLCAVVWRTNGVREVDCFSGPEFELRVILP